ncbi:MAG: hypothetical protein R3D55_16525 [Chloroflexota bacterium]
MRIKHLLLFLLLLGSLITRPVLAGPLPAHPLPTSTTAQLATANAAQDDDETATESAEAGQGWLIGLGGATLVIGLTAVGVLLNRRNKNNP